jgi:eukaryotic-like serine/threonine-protein kinase
VLWEALTQKRLFKPDDAGAACAMILSAPILRSRAVNREVSPALDNVVMKALERDLDQRFQTALEFSDALEEALPLASHRKVGKWVERLCGKHLADLADKVSDIERSGVHSLPPQDALDVLRAKHGEGPKSAEDSTGSGQGVSGNRLSLVSKGATSPPSYLARLRAAWPYAVLGAGVLLLLGSVAAWRLLRTEAVAKPTQAPPAPAVAPAAPPPAPTPSVEAADQGLEAPGGDEVAVPAPSAPKARPGKGVRANRAKRDCDPPYTIDARGIRRVKPHCL